MIDLIMNYVAFAGISALDNLYVEATGKMKAAKVLLEASEEVNKDKIRKATLMKSRKLIRPEDMQLFWNITLKENKCLMRFIILWYQLIRFVYKALYFYLFPYLIVPLSYLLYSTETSG